MSSSMLRLASMLLALLPMAVLGDDRDSIASALRVHFPGIQIVAINPAPWAGWYEVATPAELVYTNADASLLITGRVLETATRIDLTAKRWEEIRRVDMKTLPLELAIKSVRGDGSRQLVVFADPDCPYCQKLEDEMRNLTDVTVYTFLYPLEDLHPGATVKARNIWCAADPAEVWTRWMLERAEPVAAECADENIAAVRELGGKLRIIATPTLVFANGRRVDGVLSLDHLQQALSEAK